MTDVLSANALVLFLFFVVPGFVSIKVYDLLVPSERRDFGNALIEVVSYSMLNLSVWFWIPLGLDVARFQAQNPFCFYVLLVIVLLVSPVALAILFRWLLDTELLRGKVLHPSPTGWDYFFGRGEPCWILFHLKNEQRIGGYYGGNSLASSFPNMQQIYVEQLWRVDENARFTERVEGTMGGIIKVEDCDFIELYTL